MNYPDPNAYAQTRIDAMLGRMRMPNVDPNFARRSVGTALAKSRPPVRAMQMPTGSYAPGAVAPDQTIDAGHVIMKNTVGGPVYYGTQAARDLAVAGLQRVVAGYGYNHPKTRAAIQAALGVLGPGTDMSQFVQQNPFTRPRGLDSGPILP